MPLRLTKMYWVSVVTEKQIREMVYALENLGTDPILSAGYVCKKAGPLSQAPRIKKELERGLEALTSSLQVRVYDHFSAECAELLTIKPQVLHVS